MEDNAYIQDMEAEDWWIQHFIAAVQDPYFTRKLLDMGQIKNKNILFENHRNRKRPN